MQSSRVLILDFEQVFSKQAGGIKKSEFFHAPGTGSIYQILRELFQEQVYRHNVNGSSSSFFIIHLDHALANCLKF